MFYRETDEGIFNILTNMYLDYFYSRNDLIKSVDYKYLINNINGYKVDMLSMIPCIIGVKNPISINFVYKNNKYFQNITYSEIIEILNKTIPNINNEKLKKEYESEFKRISNNIPIDLLSKFIPEYKPSIFKNHKKISFKQKSSFINNRDSVLYLSDINNLDIDIELSSKIFTIDEMRKMYSMTLRLILPKYLIDKIKIKNKISFLYKSDNNKILFENKLSSKYKNIDTIHENVSTLYEIDDKTDYILTGDTLYKVYINGTIEELANMIEELSPFEIDYNPQVIGAIYFHLRDYKNIMNLLKLNDKTKENIVKKIYLRKGN